MHHREKRLRRHFTRHPGLENANIHQCAARKLGRRERGECERLFGKGLAVRKALSLRATDSCSTIALGPVISDFVMKLIPTLTAAIDLSADDLFYGEALNLLE
jgi:hypothetical protein